MTEMQKLYLLARASEGMKHRAAIRWIATRTGIDEASVSRALARAKREDDRDARKA